jgi:hypothetical protein
MTTLAPILALGVLILVFGGRLLVQSLSGRRNRPVTIEDFSRARAALHSMSLEAMATRRIFAIDDMEFIASKGALELEHFFVKERRSLAVRWLRLTQKQVAQLMDLHLRLASYTFEPSPRFEFRLTVNYVRFVVVSNALLALVWLRGPFNAVKAVSYTLSVADYFCSAFSLRLENTNPVKLGAARLPGSV